MKKKISIESIKDVSDFWDKAKESKGRFGEYLDPKYRFTEAKPQHVQPCDRRPCLPACQQGQQAGPVGHSVSSRLAGNVPACAGLKINENKT